MVKTKKHLKQTNFTYILLVYQTYTCETCTSIYLEVILQKDEANKTINKYSFEYVYLNFKATNVHVIENSKYNITDKDNNDNTLKINMNIIDLYSNCKINCI